MPLADFTLKNDDAASVGTLKYFDAGDGKIYPVSMIYVGVAGVPTQVGDSQALPVSAASLPLPSGAATAANQATANAALAAIQTAVELLDNTVVGTELQVDIVGALPAGGNAIGKLAANSGVDIGDVDVTSVTPGTTAAALGKAEDAVHATGDVGVLMLGVRRDAASSGVDTDGDYCTFAFDSSGRLHTSVSNTVTVTGTVTAAQATAANLNMTEANSAAIAASLAIVDDWDEADRAKVNPIAGQAGVQGNSGAVTALTQRVVLATDVALPAGTNLLGKAAVGEDCKIVYDGTTSVTVKYANIDTATSGNNAIVAAVANKKIKVVSLFLAASGAVDVYFNDGTANLLGGTRKVKLDNTGAVGSGGFVLQENLKGWFETAAVNRPLNLNLSAAIGVAGCLAYVEVDA
jgi:hypothetical protein